MRRGHPAAGAAGDPGRPDHLLPRGDRAVRLAGDDRHPGALQRGDDAALPVLRQSGAGRGGGGLCDAAARRHRPAVPGAAPDDPSQGLRVAHRQGRRAAADRARRAGAGRCSATPCSWRALGLPADMFLLQAAFAKAWGRGFSLDNLSLRNFHFVLFEHATAAQSVIEHLPVRRRRRHRRRDHHAGHRLYRDAPAGAVQRRAGLPVHGAVRHPGHRAGDRLLCRLCAAAAGALRHGADPDPGLHHALPADRLCQRQRGDAQHQSRRWRRRCASWAAAASPRCAASWRRCSSAACWAPGCWSSSRRRASCRRRSSSTVRAPRSSR